MCVRMCVLYAHCIIPASRCLHSALQRDAKQYDIRQQAHVRLVCYVQVDTYTLEKTRESAIYGLQHSRIRTALILDNFPFLFRIR